MARYSQYRAAAGTVKEGWGLTQAYHHAERHVSWTSLIQVFSLTITESMLGFLDYIRVERLYAARNDRHVPPWMRQRYLGQLFLSVASIRPWGSSIGRKISFSFVRPNGERSTRL